MIDVIGFLGATLLVVCALPQLFKTLKTKEVDDLSLSFFVMWFFGCLFMLIYTLCLPIISYPLIFDYVVSLIISGVLVILIYRYRK